MNANVQEILNELICRFPKLKKIEPSIVSLFKMTIETINAGGMILVCGNGGSAADAEHIVGELMKGFLCLRKLKDVEKQPFIDNGYDEIANKLQGTIQAVSLVSQIGLITAYANDIDPDLIFAQQVYGYRNPNNLLIGLSTSGNSKNVVNAVKTAKVLNMKSVVLTGRNGGVLKDIADLSIVVPEQETFKIQELHLPVYHTWCAMVESHYFLDI